MSIPVQTAVSGTSDRPPAEPAARSIDQLCIDTIRTLSDTINDAAQAAAQISASAGQQATGMAQIHQAMRNISHVTTQNLASVRQAERAAQDLNALGNTLKDLVAGYGV